MSAYSGINLSSLPFPQAIEELDYEAELQDMQQRLVVGMQEIDSAWLLLDSDPSAILLQIFAYKVIIERQRVNDQVKALFLAYSFDGNLDHIGVTYYKLPRQIIPATDQAEEIIETDERYRARCALSPEGYSVAGPFGAYTFLALNASILVKDVEPQRTTPGTVQVTILSGETDNGIASAELINTVILALNDEDVRPLNDTVIVQSATVIDYQITAELVTYDGPDRNVVLQAAQNELAAFIKDHHKLGHDITLSGINAVLKQPGVQDVIITSPPANVVIAPNEVAYCTAHSVALGGIDE